MSASILRPLADNDERWFGSIDLRVFDQGSWWLTRQRAPARISEQRELADTELVTVMGDLHDRRVELQNAYCFAFPARTVLSDPTGWLESTELMIALRAEAALRGLDIAKVADETPHGAVSEKQMTTICVVGGQFGVATRLGGIDAIDLDEGTS